MIYVTTRPELFSSQLAHSDISSELYHHGIKGQRWGVRRYQNSDGSLTEEGKIHYGRDHKSLISDNTKQKIKKAAKLAAIGIGVLGGVLALSGGIDASLIDPVSTIDLSQYMETPIGYVPLSEIRTA